MAEAKTANEDPSIDEPVDGEEAAATSPKRSKLKMLAIGGVALTLSLGAGGYFAVPMALAMFAPADGAAAHEAAVSAESGAAEASKEEANAENGASGGGHGGSAASPLPEALPVIRLALPQRAAADYQIVSIFEGEAFLATSDAVIRVQVGSTAPGLGDILAIEASDTGGVVKGTLATLTTS